MTPQQQKQFDRARQAYETAWAEMTKWGDKALEALRKQELVGKASADLFQKIANDAFLASENWRRAANLALSVMQEIASGFPRGSEVCVVCGCDDFQPSPSDPDVCDNGGTAGVRCGHRRQDHI